MTAEVGQARAAVLGFALASLRGEPNAPVEQYAAKLVDGLIAAVRAEKTPLPPISSHTYEGPGPCRADLFGETCGGGRDDHRLVNEESSP